MHKEKDEIIGGLWWQRFYLWKRVISIETLFFQETHQIESDVHFKDYQPNVICYQYSNLVCVAHINLIEVKSNKKLKARRWKMSKVDHERIIEDDIPLWSYF